MVIGTQWGMHSVTVVQSALHILVSDMSSNNFHSQGPKGSSPPTKTKNSSSGVDLKETILQVNSEYGSRFNSSDPLFLCAVGDSLTNIILLSPSLLTKNFKYFLIFF